MERRLAAILAADVMGYSRHTERNEEASTVTLRMYRAVVEEAISAHRGRIFSSAGDGVVAEFPSIVEAIRCAIEIQNEIAERNASVPERDRMQFRIGVNLGDVIAEDNNLYGTGVNVAVRLEQLAEPAGICISQTVYDQVRKIVEIPFQDIGERRLKNIADPVHVYRILPAPLPWLKGLFSRATLRQRRLGFAGGMLLLLLAVAAEAFYLRQPAALWDVLLGPSLPEQPTVAVLPFEDLSAGGEQQYLADAITADLNQRLGTFPDLEVIARDLKDKKEPTDILKVGEELNVRYIIKGSMQTSDKDLHVWAQLIDASAGNQLWANRYDRQSDNMEAARDDITQSIAGELGGLNGKLSQAEIKRISGKDPASFTAYDYLRKGWREWRKWTKELNAAARDLFEKARKNDPNYARAYVGLMWTYAIDYDFWCTEDEEFRKAAELALARAEEAVRLDPNDYQTHWALGWARLYNGQHAAAEKSYTLARKLNPNDPELLAEMANLLIYMGRPQQAIEQVIESKRLDPSPEAWVDQYLGWAYEEAGQPEQAIETLKPVVSEDMPTEFDRWVLPTLASAYVEVGQTEDADRIVKILGSHWPEFSTAKVAELAPYQTPQLRERYVKALERAGLPK